MGTTWVLHTETKGTGATMVPIDSVTKRAPDTEPVFVPPKPVERPQHTPEAAPAHRFKVVNVVTQQELVDDGSARDAVDALNGIRSIVDVDVYVWHEERERWRKLTFGERRAMWELART